VRSLAGAFALDDWRWLHAADGTPGTFVAGQIRALDRVNPQPGLRGAHQYVSTVM
jgi:hypothetical protein